MSAQNYHVIVCDDEADLRETVGEYLQKRGYTVSLTSNGAELDALLDQQVAVDAVLLDITMPGEDGLSILRRLRSDRSVAVLMLTASGGVIDRVVGLELGADDYIAKPVDLRELDARIRAVLRRPEHLRQDAEPDPVSREQNLQAGGLTLDAAGVRLVRGDGSSVKITAMEFLLLKVFFENQGRVLNRDQLLAHAHERGWDPFDRSIDIRISRLRRKIEPDPGQPIFIKTVRGIGYIFDPPAA